MLYYNQHILHENLSYSKSFFTFHYFVGFCLTYKTRSTPHAGTLGTAKVSIATDSGCAVNFVLSGKKNRGEETTVCDKSCPDGNLENAIVKIQQKSWDGWGIEHIKIKDIDGNRSPYSLDGKVMQFWVDGNKNGNYDGLSKCTWGKWCDLYKIGKNRIYLLHVSFI